MILFKVNIYHCFENITKEMIVKYFKSNFENTQKTRFIKKRY